MLIVTSLNGNVEPLVDYKDLKRKRKVNAGYSLSFTLLSTTRNEQSYPLVIEESLLEYDGQTYRVKKLVENIRGKTPVKAVFAEHVFIGDLIDGYEYNIIGGNKTFVELLQFVLGPTSYTFEIIGAFEDVLIFNFGAKNRLQLLLELMQLFGAEFEPGDKHFRIYNQIGTQNNFQFRYRYNVKTITKSIDTSKLSTFVKGYGTGFEVDYTSPNADVFGIRHAEPIMDYSFSDPDALLEKMKRSLKDEPEISITVETTDLDGAGLGDNGFVIYDPLGVNIAARIMEIEDFPEERKVPIITIGNVSNGKYADILAQMANDMQQTKVKTERNRSEIKQTNDMISLEVERIDGELEKHSASITITAGEIRSEVSRLEGDISTNKSLISQTADEILLEVQQLDTDLRSTISQTAGEIRSEVAQTKEGLSSQISQNANSISSLVSQQSEIDGRMSSAESRISQTASDLSFKVSTTDYNGTTIASKLNLSSSTISLNAAMIDLFGIVRVNKNLQLGESYDYGSIEFVNDGLSSAKISAISAGGMPGLSISAGEVHIGSSLYVNDKKVLTEGESMVAVFG